MRVHKTQNNNSLRMFLNGAEREHSDDRLFLTAAIARSTKTKTLNSMVTWLGVERLGRTLIIFI